MPIGFWAVSRRDIKECLAFYMEDYHKDPNLITAKDVDRFIREISEKLDDTLRDAYLDLVTGK